MTRIDRTQARLAAVTVFRDELRVRVLELVSENGVPIPCETLATELNPGPETKERQRLVNELHHNHVPTLANTGVLDYDATTRRITDFDPEQLAVILDTTVALCESLRPDRR